MVGIQAGVPAMPETVEIVSDQRLLVEGLERILGPCLARARSARGSRTGKEPMVVLDATLEDATRRCVELVRDGRIVIVLGVADDECALAALRAGARGVVGRHAGGDELSRAIRAVANGQLWAPRRLLACALGLLSATGGSGGGGSGPLTHREEQIVDHALGGLNNKEIADRLAIRPCTVKAHLTSVFRKLSVRDRTQLVVRYRHLHSSSVPSLPTPRRVLVRARTIVARQLILLLSGAGAAAALACGASATRDEGFVPAPPASPAAGQVTVRASAPSFPVGAVVGFSVANGLATRLCTDDVDRGPEGEEPSVVYSPTFRIGP